jgi:hypothetical protein
MKKTYDDQESKTGLDGLGEEPKFGSPDFLREAIKNSEVILVPI